MNIRMLFDQVMELLTTTTVRVYFRDGTREGYVMETDGILVGLDAVVEQAQPDGRVHPISYVMWSLQSHLQQLFHNGSLQY